MQKLILLLILAVASSAGSCEKENALQGCTLKAGESSGCGFPDLSVRFDSTLADSRCPKGATCIWAGEVVVGLTVNDTRVELAMSPRRPGADSASVHGHVFRLLEVAPYPEVGKTIEPDAYRIRLDIH